MTTATLNVALVTLFPEMFSALTASGITGRAYERGLYELFFANPRDFAEDKHKSVDDKPYGGGPGMVMSVKPVAKALEAAQASFKGRANVIYLSPQGRPLTQQIVSELAQKENLVLLCGRYEGIDERVIEQYVDEELSIGDYVISGGELAAMVLLDAVIRLQPGALGDSESAEQDSFAGKGLLDFPHYTRPEIVNGHAVPNVLLSGDHAAIADWRLKAALKRTLQRRPELLEQCELSRQEKALLVAIEKDLNSNN